MKIEDFRGDYAFLSNFYPCSIGLGHRLYASVEHAYQASKTLDEASRVTIWGARTAGQAKRLGRSLVLRPDWESVKVNIMLGFLRQKFVPSGDLWPLLDKTGEVELIEGNWWGDTFWGVCRGVGDNHLGKLLMQVREENR